MEYRRFDNTIVVRMDRGEEIMSQLREVAEKEQVKLASVSALGAVDRFTVGAYDVKQQKYLANSFEGVFEIASLTGSINTMNDEYYAHIHMVAADEKGNAFGGHLNEAFISVTCEMFITVIDGRVDRYRDEEIGINLFKF